MSYYRSYFNKNNTIIKDSLVNTSKSPYTEIYYGDGYSKFIFQVDFTNLLNKINKGDLVVNSDTKHYLRMTNTIFGSESFVGQQNDTGGHRATSFDLTLIPLTEFWDEGVGIDYTDVDEIKINNNKTYDIRPSNWYNRTTLNTWGVDGIYDTIPNDNSYNIHFDNGDENINIDVTDYVNNIINGEINYGLVLAFNIPFFDIAEFKQSVAFFTKYTQTFFEPFIESVFNDTIDDNRDNFINDIERSLYLYITKHGNPYDLDVLPLVTILDSTNTNFDVSLSGMTAEKVRKGVYKITFGLTGTYCDGKRFYYDKWHNIIVDGILINDIKQRFVPKQYSEIYNIGYNTNDSTKYVIKYNGIKTNEKIKRGEIRKVNIIFKSFQQTSEILSNELYYRIYIKEGRTQVNVFDWTKLDKTNENSFLLDTSFLIPREYNIEFKCNINSEEILYNNEIKFEIVSEK